jgi:2-hydroxychromene-2-carboxylate isomerase
MTAIKEAETVGKAKLKENTDQAFEQGAFGLPWMVCERAGDCGRTEGFWGVDHLGQVASFLGLERPGEGAWRAVL